MEGNKFRLGMYKGEFIVSPEVFYHFYSLSRSTCADLTNARLNNKSGARRGDSHPRETSELSTYLGDL